MGAMGGKTDPCTQKFRLLISFSFLDADRKKTKRIVQSCRKPV